MGVLGGLILKPTGFDPLSFNPVIWLDSKDASTKTFDTGRLKIWADKSGFGNDAVQNDFAKMGVSDGSDPVHLVQFEGMNAPKGIATDTSDFTLIMFYRINLAFTFRSGIISSGSSSFFITAWDSVPEKLRMTANGSGAFYREYAENVKYAEITTGVGAQVITDNNDNTDIVSLTINNAFSIPEWQINSIDLNSGKDNNFYEIIVLPYKIADADKQKFYDYLFGKYS